MADIKKFLDQAGVSTLWNQVVAKIDEKVGSLENYDDTEVRGLIGDNTDAIAAEKSRAEAAEKVNADAIAILNGGSTVEGSVAFQIAEIVAGAGESYDTLKEIADWIGTHTSDVATMNSNIKTNSDDIAALEALVGSTAVATQIADAIANAGHASASDLSAAVSRIAALESWKATHADEYTNLNTAFNALKGKVDEITATGGEPNVIETIQVNGVSLAPSDKTVNIVLSEYITALTEDEIKAACVSE